MATRPECYAPNWRAVAVGTMWNRRSTAVWQGVGCAISRKNEMDLNETRVFDVPNHSRFLLSIAAVLTSSNLMCSRRGGSGMTLVQADLLLNALARWSRCRCRLVVVLQSRYRDGQFPFGGCHQLQKSLATCRFLLDVVSTR